jgi:vacuolar iron transporter family protein
MTKFELGLERPDPRRAPISAATIAASYFIGGLIPLLPYMIAGDLKTALLISVICTGVALLAFGAVKGKLTGVNIVKSSLQSPGPARRRLRRAETAVLIVLITLQY